MAVTFRELMNRVLGVLDPSDQIASGTSELSEDYHKLVARFVNTIKEEVEDSHNWRALRQVHSATISADALSGTVTNATERSRLLRVQDAMTGMFIPLVYDVTDASNPVRLIELDLPWVLDRDKIDPDQRASNEPTYFALDNSSGDVLDVLVWPRPSSTRTLSLILITPQAYLANDNLDVNIVIPTRPIITGALWYALEERGEELGVNALFSEERYNKALDAAIARDSAEAGDAYELIPQ